MRQQIMAVALVLMLGAALAGCQTSSGYYDPGASAAGGMLAGAAGGAALGSIIGAATGNPGAGAWIGAASGAGVGALAGSVYARDQNQNLARAQAEQGAPPPGYGPGYGPGRGNLVAIDQAFVQPNVVRPGSQVMLIMKYRVMSPQNQPVPVQLVREISKDGQLINQPYQEERQVPNGTYGARVAYNVPPDFPPGNYVATFRIFSSLGNSEKSVYFSVQ
jgi:hypothetical protein